MEEYAQMEEEPKAKADVPAEAPVAKAPATVEEPTEVAAPAPAPAPALAPGQQLPAFDPSTMDLTAITSSIANSITEAIISGIVNSLSERFLGGAPVAAAPVAAAPVAAAPVAAAPVEPAAPPKKKILASKRIKEIKSFALPIESDPLTVNTIKLGNLPSEGGTRGRTYFIGGMNCMPFHLWEGQMPHKPLVAMEVFDVVSDKTPPVMQEVFGDLLSNPVEMAKVCVEQHGADLISVRLEGTHPEKGDRTPAQSVELVKAVLAAVDVPLIITGITHFEKNNEVMKAIAAACEGENLLFNWVEPDNYRTIAGVCMAYGHSVIAQAPIDVNISKQMAILLTNMGLPIERIVIDPLTSPLGYGLEYTYSVMERIRLTALGGDKMLLLPMMANIGQECSKVKEYKAPEKDFPEWGDASKRAEYWEVATGASMIHAGADLLIMYLPGAVATVKKAIVDLMDIDSEGGAK
jgi:acetyl-CoA decarbonylase/synthase complex subunit delta